MLDQQSFDQIRARRAEGKTYRQVADEFGISHEYVRILTHDVKVVHECKHCAREFESRTGNSTVCMACRVCSSCGIPLSQTQWKSKALCRDCKPRKTELGTRTTKVEEGIYVREYIATDQTIPGYRVFLRDAIGEKCKWQTHATIEEARAARAEAKADGRLGKRGRKPLDRVPG